MSAQPQRMIECPQCGERPPEGLHGWTVTPMGRCWRCPKTPDAPIDWRSRALKAEQERDEAWRAFGFEKPVFGMSLAHQIGGTLEELQVAEQERDEAVEALEPFAKAAIYFDGYGGNKANPPTDDHVFFGWPDHKVTIGHFRTASQVHARLKGAE